MTKYLIIAVAVLVALLGGSLYGLKATRDTLALTNLQLDSYKAALVASQALTARVQTLVVKEKTRADANRLELRNALKNNADWAARPVPADVAGSLCKPPAKCASGTPAVR